MLVTLGDLIDDIVVRPMREIRVATDTPSQISRRRGGSAANVAAVAAGLGAPARFIGQVGADPVGDGLLDEMRALGVDVEFVRREGATGSIVVVLDAAGERTMLTDRRTCVGLSGVRRVWLDGASVLHLPLYSFSEGPIADTARATVELAHELGVTVSIDLSSTALIAAMGRAAVESLMAGLRPDIVFANADEAHALDVAGPVAGATTVVKRGSAPATVFVPGAGRVEVSATQVAGVVDTTGAGDAFAAGFLTVDLVAASASSSTPRDACRAGHDAASRLLRSR